MSIHEEPKIDCHAHVFDPDRFPYQSDTFYRPSGQELGTLRELDAVFETHGVQRALLVGPDSGYGRDSTCLLDALERSDGRFRGVAVAPRDVSRAELRQLRTAGVRGISCNVALHGPPALAEVIPLLRDLADLNMLVDLQVQGEQLLDCGPALEGSRVRLLVDHCGRPDPRAGTDQPGFRALLDLADTGRTFVKLSGYAKFSHRPYPHEDIWPYVAALLAAFGPERCVWGSDWPFLRAPARVDYGPLLTLLHRLVPADAQRVAIFWNTPHELFDFGG